MELSVKTMQKVCLAVAVTAATLAAQNPVKLVAPNGNTNFSGNTSNSIPTTPTSVEFQEVIGGGQMPLNPVLITGMSFRAAPGTGPLSEKMDSLSVTLSASPKFPNGGASGLMSSTFADNVGADKTLVFSGSNLVVNDAGCAKPGPCSFNINLTFTTAYRYSGTGPLLIDISFTNLSGTGAIDAASFQAPGGSVAQVSGTLGSPTGTFQYQGNIVQLTYTQLVSNIPAITGVVNVAANVPPGPPNYGLAQGSLFAIYGSKLGPASLSVSGLPFPTTGLSGTSLTVSVNGTSLNAPIYFTRSDIVVGVIPSNTPVGNGQVIVNFNGARGAAPITVVQSAFGISNLLITNANNGPGVQELAAVTFNGTTVTVTNTAKPGDTVTIWGTGLGATLNNGGDTGPPPVGNIGSAPQVFVGGVLSPSVGYWGRSAIPGLDQINAVIPQDAPLGCNVSIVVQTMNGNTPIVSNGPTIALSNTDGGTCSDPTQLVPSSYLTRGSTSVMFINVQQSVSINPNQNGTTTTTTSSREQVAFFQATQAQLAALVPGVNAEPSLGTCYTTIVSSNANSGGGGVPGTLLDAGMSVTLTPPSGAPLMLPAQGPGFYGTNRSSATIPSGTWNFSNGAGGAAVGPLSFSFPVPQVTWLNQAAVSGSPISRNSPLTITWSGGDSNGYVDIQGWAFTGGFSGPYTVGFECAALASAGQFTIPPSILLAMPTGANAFGSIQVSTNALPYTLGTIPGLDAALNASTFQTSAPVVFQ